MEIINDFSTTIEDCDISIVILHNVFNSPIVGISKRDMVDKRITFRIDGALYCFQSSIDEKLGKEICDPGEGVVRAISHINATRMWEDETQYHMISFNQTDLRVYILLYC